MADKRKLTGHPWHVEFLKMDENDTRRHRKKCTYYVPKNYCRKYGNCIGSAHCSFYKEGFQQSEDTSSVNKLSPQQIDEMIRKIFGEV